MFVRSGILALSLFLAPFPALLEAAGTLPENYCTWEASEFAIEQPLCGLSGDIHRGKQIATDAYQGNCLACHQLPVEGIEAYGNIGPPLQGLASRMTVPQIRLRVVDTRHVNPMSIMPGFYRDPRLINRPDSAYRGKTFLTAQQVEDVIAYLATLK